MSISMRARAGDYLEMRRSLGYKLCGEGRMLAGFATRCDEEGQATITISAALAWATESRDAAPAHWRRRLSVVRGFARYLATLDPACQIPPADLLPAPSHRPPPYIYSAEEIAALIHAAGYPSQGQAPPRGAARISSSATGSPQCPGRPAYRFAAAVVRVVGSASRGRVSSLVFPW